MDDFVFATSVYSINKFNVCTWRQFFIAAERIFSSLSPNFLRFSDKTKKKKSRRMKTSIRFLWLIETFFRFDDVIELFFFAALITCNMVRGNEEWQRWRRWERERAVQARIMIPIFHIQHSLCVYRFFSSNRFRGKKRSHSCIFLATSDVIRLGCCFVFCFVGSFVSAA